MKRPLSKSFTGNIAFISVVLITIALIIISLGNSISLVQYVVIFTLALLYLGIGITLDTDRTRFTSTRFTVVFFGVELVLGGIINQLSQGAAWLILLPMASLAVEFLPNYWNYGACLVIWMLDVIPFALYARTSDIITWSLDFLAAIIFVAIFTRVSVNEQQARCQLAEANRKLREYAARAEELATTQERNRLAREIHDGLGHYLTAINIQIEAAQAIMSQDSAQAAASMSKAQTLTQEALTEVRRSVAALRADPLVTKPLPATIQDLLNELATAGIQVEFVLKGEARPLQPQVELALYRIAQEALTNVRKHAQASQVVLTLEYQPDIVNLTIQDNGIGSRAPEGGFGLVGLRERAHLLGGIVDTHSVPGESFTLEAKLPAGKVL
ncbi:MAG TPA: sensor histidine kinase [Longilinea sp.]|nr:sensor histidine kinase [Longilinea sp.]